MELVVAGYVVGHMRAGWGPGEHCPPRPVRRRAPHLTAPPARPMPTLTFVRSCPADRNYTKLLGSTSHTPCSREV